jgi:hypothetical protein
MPAIEIFAPFCGGFAHSSASCSGIGEGISMDFGVHLEPCLVRPDNIRFHERRTMRSTELAEVCTNDEFESRIKPKQERET